LSKHKTNKKGKPVGKAVLTGFALDYSTAMNRTNAGNSLDYQIAFVTTKRVKRKTVTVLNPVRFSTSYSASNYIVTLIIKGNPKFAKGGQIRVIATPPNGVDSQVGVPLNPNSTLFIIGKNANTITRG
jgi:hypothetical protein